MIDIEYWIIAMIGALAVCIATLITNPSKASLITLSCLLIGFIVGSMWALKEKQQIKRQSRRRVKGRR